MLLQRHNLHICRKNHNALAQLVFKTAPLFAHANPDPAAPQTVIDAFTAFFESLWDPAIAATQMVGISYEFNSFLDNKYAG
jgi:hypothetical protein